MKKEVLRDRTVDWVERLLKSPGFEKAQAALIVISILYFAVVFCARHS